MDDVTLSKSSTWSAGKSVITKEADQVRAKFRQQISEEDMSRCLIAHFDGKCVKELTEGRSVLNHRISLLVSSPKLETPQLLGVPIVETASGLNQKEEVIKLLKVINNQGTFLMMPTE